MSIIQVDTTPFFDKWFNKLKDRGAKAIITAHIERISDDNLGVIRSVGGGVFEKKINYASGYRLYFYHKGEKWILLLCGGDKSTQKADIKRAKEIRKGLQ